MQEFRFINIARMAGVAPLRGDGNQVIEHLLTNSRMLLFPETTVFFAISSANRRAESYIKELYAGGVRCFVIADDYDASALLNLPEIQLLAVQDVQDALQQVAAVHRQQFSYPVIGLTGSNGKTIIKEWLYQLLNPDFNIVRSPKSYNSQVGVPLSVWQMNEANGLGIFEAGISQPGEMARLEEVIRPNLGLLGFIGDAHAAGFSSRREKINEKLKLFTRSQVLFYNSDDAMVHEAVTAFQQEENKHLQTFSWSKHSGADVMLSAIEQLHDKALLHCRYGERALVFALPFADEASVFNAMMFILVMLYFKVNEDIIAQRLEHLRPVEMRLELKQGINRCSIINDSYSSDLSSLSIALEFLQQQHQHQQKTVILSDVLQSNLGSSQLYSRIAAILTKQSLHRFIGIGPHISAHAAAFNNLPSTHFFTKVDDFLEQLPALHFSDETILVKGARLFRFEQISHALEQKKHETSLEINLNALRHNFKLYKSFLRPGVKVMAMVKAFSYGSGSHEIAGLLQQAGVDFLGVAYADEGVDLRKGGISVPVMVMNTEVAGFENIIRYNLEPELYSFNILRAFKNFLLSHNIRGYNVHIKLDTGMHRLGFETAQMPALLAELAGETCFRVSSVFSHLAGSGEPAHDAFTTQQAEAFISMADKIEKTLGYTFIRHIGNTAAVHRHPNLQMDMVRLGIGLYGIDSAAAVQQQLMTVTTLRTTISQVRKVAAGESVGYSRASIVARDAVIATVRLGYADGYPRLLGNGRGRMLVNGQLAPVIGNVCMDMTMLDITGIEAAEEDEVIVFGEDLPVSLLAEWAETIPYEMLTNISQRVRRVYFEE